jgi:hypothetical protein
MLRSLLGTVFALSLVVALPSSARAVTAHVPNARNVAYVIGFHPLHSSTQPYLGQLHLNFANGIISGTYTDISVKPGSPFANAHNLSVSGGVTSDHVTLIIKNVTFKGTMTGQKMSGSATIRGRLYQFEAHPGSPGSGKVNP